jgi:hypothetical protein
LREQLRDKSTLTARIAQLQVLLDPGHAPAVPVHPFGPHAPPSLFIYFLSRSTPIASPF